MFGSAVKGFGQFIDGFGLVSGRLQDRRDLEWHAHAVFAFNDDGGPYARVLDGP